MAPYPIPTSTVEHSILQINSILIKNQIEIILVERDKIFNFLATAFFVKKVWQSAANFILFEVFDKKKVLSHCLSNGIVIRDRSNDYNLNNCLRITIGTPEENNFFIEVMKNV